MSKVQVDTIDTRSGTSTMQIGSTNTSTINLGVSGDTVNIPSGVTIANAGTATGFGLDGTPNFLAYRSSSDQSITNNTYTKVQFNSESYDTDNAYDNSTNYRFTPQIAGKYFVYGNIFHSWNTNHGWQQKTIIRKNGTDIAVWSNLSNGIDAGQYGSMYTSTTVAMNGSTDYLELFGSFNATSPFFAGGLSLTYFGAYKIIE